MSFVVFNHVVQFVHVGGGGGGGGTHLCGTFTTAREGTAKIVNAFGVGRCVLRTQTVAVVVHQCRGTRVRAHAHAHTHTHAHIYTHAHTAYTLVTTLHCCLVTRKPGGKKNTKKKQTSEVNEHGWDYGRKPRTV